MSTTSAIEICIGDEMLQITLEAQRAPLGVANLLAYIDGGHYHDARLYRVVDPSNDSSPTPIKVAQFGILHRLQTIAAAPLPPIAHESTRQTGLSHVRGAVSYARQAPGTAVSEFFVCLRDEPTLDFGGARVVDGQGFSVIGHVVRGLAALEASHARALAAGTDGRGMMREPVAVTIRKAG